MALCKTIEKSIDTDQIRAEASALAANLAGQAERAAEWVGPRVTKAAGEVARGRFVSFPVLVRGACTTTSRPNGISVSRL